MHSTVGVRRGGLSSPFKHNMENRWVVSARHRRRQWDRICSILISERKGKEERCQKARNGPEPYLCGREAAQMDDHTIGCLYLAVIVQYVITYMLWFMIHISFATNPLVFCSSVLPGCGKYWLKICNLDQRISTVGQQICIKKDNLMH